MNMSRLKRLEKGIIVFAYLLMLFICIELFYRQSIEYNHSYPADLKLHIYYADIQKGTNYSLVSLVFNILHSINGSTFYIAIFLSSMVVGTIYLTYVYLKETICSLNDSIAHVLAFSLNLIMPIFISMLNSNRYLGLISGSIWHNPTFTCMKFFGLLALIIYCKMHKNTEKNIYLFVFSFILCLVTIIKPNFILVLLPTVLIVLLVETIKKRSNFKKTVILLVTFLPSCLILFFQYCVLYGDGQTDSSIGFNFGYIISHYSQRPVAAIIQSVAFPILVLLANIKNLKKDKMYAFSWVLWLIALIQYLCLVETGERALHGNWGWGVLFYTFFLFVTSVLKLIQNISEENIIIGHQFLKRISLRRIYYGIASIVFLMHIYFGCQYLLIILHGNHYI